MYNVLKRAKDADIYRAYVAARGDETKTARTVLHKFGISRGHLYNVVRRVQHGNTAAIRKGMENARLEVLWEYKYKVRFEALPKNREASTITELRFIVRAMEHDRFPQSRIAEFLKKNRSTIISHLKR